MSHALQIVGPDAVRECRQFPLGRFEVVNIAGHVLGRAVYQPGWRWSQHVGAAYGEIWCPVEHVGFVLAGRAAVRMKDGTEAELGVGNWFSIPAGHDSWVLGDQDYVSLHVLGAGTYATPAAASITGEAAPDTPPVSAATVRPSASGDGCTRWTLLARPTLHVMEEQMAAGTEEIRHLHPNTIQFYYVLDGTAMVEVRSTSVAVEAGQAIEIGVGDPYQIRNETDAGLRFLVISLGYPRDDCQDLQ